MGRVSALSLAVVLSVSGVIAAGPTTSFSLTLVNSGRHTLSVFRVSPPSSPDWGDNLLAQPLRPHRRTTVTIDGGCGQYDVRFTAEGDTRLHEEDVTLCDGDTLTVGDRTIARTEAPTE
jgi:hypothetical protein